MRTLIPLFFLLLCLSACVQQTMKPVDSDKPQRPKLTYFDKKYLLYQLPVAYYKNDQLNTSAVSSSASFITHFSPLGFDTALNLQYTHIYSDQCIYHTSDTVWKYAEVCFPNTCLTQDKAYAVVTLCNTSAVRKKYKVRLFYQNTTYWYATDSSIDLNSSSYLDNYYGASEVINTSIEPFDSVTIRLPYSIGMNPKHEFDFDPSKDPARPGNYEFMILAKEENTNEPLLNPLLDLQQTNPFAVVKKDELANNGKNYKNHLAYVGPHHFKFVFLDEYFDGINDLTPGHIYVPKDGKEKPLCDTCSGWYKSIISEHWNAETYFKGLIKSAGYVKAKYGIRKENTTIDSSGVILRIPKSRRGDYNKNWGEFLFGPSLKYGHLTIRAKFAQMFTNWGTPNGIVHNLWLYQRDPDAVDTNQAYRHLVNGVGLQPFEIDFEVWSSQENINTMWDDNAFINYSIVDYMRDEQVKIKPGEQKKLDGYNVNRLNDRQLNIPGENLPRSFFDSFHTYELYWYPDRVRFLLDGKQTALITRDMAKIPDKHSFLWIGSPMYQDGTYYEQSSIPFLKYDKRSIIDYIRIE